MGKLHLKRTPEEEAERKRHKKRKKEPKKSKRHYFPESSTRPRSADASPTHRRWASDEDDVDVYGPPPPAFTPSTSKGESPCHHHGSKPDYEAIRAELEEQRFREKLFGAFDDDERLDSLEARFNDYSHVPDRWRNDPNGKRKPFNTDEDEFLQMDPQYMDDEEYAEWIRLGMYRKTHRDEYEEQQREKARKKEREAREKAAKVEAERLQQAMEEEQKRRREEKENARWGVAKEIYESRWTELLKKNSDNGDGEKDNNEGRWCKDIRFEDIPWPVITAYPKAKKRRRDPTPTPTPSLEDFTVDAIRRFVLTSAPTIGPTLDQDQEKKERKDKLRETMLRFHPDKFEGRVMGRVREADKGRVREAVGQVARVLNDLMGEGD